MFGCLQPFGNFLSQLIFYYKTTQLVCNEVLILIFVQRFTVCILHCIRYGEFSELSGTLLKYIRPSDRILVAGCGNSDLSADFYDVGCHNIVNIDISSTVIHQMSSKHGDARPDMKFLQMDLLEVHFSCVAFSVYTAIHFKHIVIV